jgi:chitinase
MKHKKSRFVCGFSLALMIVLLSACSSTAAKTDASQAKVSSYIRTWPLAAEEQQNGSLYWNAEMIRGEYLSDLIISFALIDPADGSTIYIPELREHGEPLFSNIWDEVKKLHEKFPHLKVTVSAGGYGAEGFSDMSADPAKRSAFVGNIVTWVRDYGLDGIDIDWEYPVGPEWGQEIKSSPADKKNYVTLLQEIRYALDALSAENGHEHYTLSVAVPASNWYPSTNDVVAVAKIVDTLKLMAYDYYGSWSNTTGHHANLSNNPDDPAWGGWSTEQAVQAYLDAFVPASKISMGIGFYGKAWAGVEAGETHGLFQPYKSLPFDQGSISWTEIKKLLEPGSGYTRYWDETAQSPYLYNGDIWISYCDEEAIALINQYVKDMGLNGVFTWEYAHDIRAELLKVLAEGAR